LKAWQLDRRVNTLSEKIKDTTSKELIHLDFDSFSEAEKLLFRKVDEIEEKYLQTGSTEHLDENFELICKNLEVIFRRVRELYCYVVPMVLGSDGSHEIVEYFFKLHFLNFEADLAECLANERSWSEKDRDDFLADIRKNGSFFFRIPRGFKEHNDKDLACLKKKRKVKSGPNAHLSKPDVLDQRGMQMENPGSCGPTLDFSSQRKGDQNMNANQENKTNLDRR
jgi:hypothetical protein